MTVLALLDNGACEMKDACLDRPADVHARCPQIFKCGTCVAWSPRQANGYGRNSGQCMLDRDATQYLDCNAPICPYYRPRHDSPAYEAWRSRSSEGQRKVRASKKRLDRQAPAPTPEALAAAAFAEHAPEVADAGAPVLAASLRALGPMPVLLERFRGGRVSVSSPALAEPREAPVEAFFARLALLRRALVALEGRIEASSLAGDERAKVQKDLAGIGGSMTTFNLLLKDREDHFRGQSRG